MKEWKESTIENVCSVVTDGSHFSPKAVAQGHYMVSVKDFENYGFNFSECKQISDEDYETLKDNGCVPEKQDILIGKDGARYFEDIIIYEQPESPALLSSIAILRSDPKIVRPYFLYYYLKNPIVQKDVKDNYGSGSAIPRIVLKDFKRMPVYYPDLLEQDRIIAVLKAIDNKVHTNEKINKNLLEQLQAYYLSRFGEVGEAGGTLSDICHYSKEKIEVSQLSVDTYYSTENMQPNKAGAVVATSLPTVGQTTRCNKGDVLVSNIRPYFKKIVLATAMCGCSGDVLCFVPEKEELSSYLYMTLFVDRFFTYMVAGSKGTKMPRGDKQQIMSYGVVLPGEDELASFNEIANPMLSRIEANREENIQLEALRDSLLPRLMSGELEVSSVEV